MKTFMRILTVALMVFSVAALTLAREEGVRSKSFAVSKGGTIEVSTGVGDVRITTWEKNEVDVTGGGTGRRRP